jgi:hypothetical protein
MLDSTSSEGAELIFPNLNSKCLFSSCFIFPLGYVKAFCFLSSWCYYFPGGFSCTFLSISDMYVVGTLTLFPMLLCFQL